MGFEIGKPTLVVTRPPSRPKPKPRRRPAPEPKVDPAAVFTPAPQPLQPLHEAQQQAASRTTKLKAKADIIERHAENVTKAGSKTYDPYTQLKRAYDKLPPSRRTEFIIANMQGDAPKPYQDATARLQAHHDQRRHVYRESRIHQARLDVLKALQVPGRPATTQIEAPKISPDAAHATRKAIEDLFAPGDLARQRRGLGALRDQNILTGVGPQETKRTAAARKLYRKQLLHAAVQTEVDREHTYAKGGLNVPGREALAMARKKSNAELIDYLNWKPSTYQTETAGLDAGNLVGLVKGMTAQAGLIGRGTLGHNIAGNLLGDAISWPVQGVTAAYSAADAALHPSTKGKAFVEGIGQQIAHPIKSFEEHPLYTALLARGGLSLVGRGVGAAGRIAGGNRASGPSWAKALGSEARAGLEDQGIQLPRNYSRDAIVKAIQYGLDQNLIRRSGKYHSETGPAGAPMTTFGGREVPTIKTIPRSRGPRAIHDLRQNQIADLSSSVMKTGQQSARNRTAAEIKETMATRGSGAFEKRLNANPLHSRTAALMGKFAPNIVARMYRPERDVQSLVNRGVVRTAETFWEDLAKIRKRIEARLKVEDGLAKEHKDYTPEQRDLADSLVDSIRHVEANRAHVNVQSLFDAREGFAKLAGRNEQASIEHGIIEEGQIKAKNYEYAQEHMDATHGKADLTDERASVPDSEELLHHRREYAKAVSRRKTTERRLEQAQRAEANAQGRAEVLSRNVSGRAGEKAAQTVKSKPKYAGGGHGVKKANEQIKARAEAVEAAKKAEDMAAEDLRAAQDAHASFAARERGQQHTLLDRHGKPLSNDAIEAHMRRNGVDPEHISYIPNTMAGRGTGAFFKRANLVRRNIHTGPKTGSAWEKGAVPHDFEHLAESIIGRATTLDSIAAHDHLIKTQGIKKPGGDYFKPSEVEYVLAHNGYGPDGKFYGKDLVGVRAFNARLHDQAKVAEAQSSERVFEPEQHLMHGHFSGRILTSDEVTSGGQIHGDRRVANMVLMPKALTERLLRQAEPGEAAPTLNFANQMFRRTVLPLSAKWLFGNTFEAAIRSAVAGVSPADFTGQMARKVFREMIEQDARATHGAAAEPLIKAASDARTLRSRLPGEARKTRLETQRNLESHAPHATAVRNEMISGLMYGNPSLSRHQVGGHTVGGQLGHQATQLPVVHELSQTLKTVTNQIFHGNASIEHFFERAVFSKHIRNEMRRFGVSWHKAIRMQETAVEQAAKGMLHTPEQIRAAQYMHEVLGKYSGFGPTTRKTIQRVAPFLPWYLNSARFVLHTLPVKYPVTTAILAQAERAFQQDWEDQHKGTPKGSLRTAISTKKGYVDLGRYTPFGYLGPVAGGDLGAAISPALPQLAGLYQGFHGKDPFGRDLQTTGPDGKPHPVQGGALVKYLVNQAAEETLPGLSLARRLQEHGDTGDPTSTAFAPKTKPGSAHGRSAIDRIFNPTSPVYLKAQKKKGGGAPRYRKAPGNSVDDLVKALSGGSTTSAPSDAAVDALIKSLG